MNRWRVVAAGAVGGEFTLALTLADDENEAIKIALDQPILRGWSSRLCPKCSWLHIAVPGLNGDAGPVEVLLVRAELIVPDPDAKPNLSPGAQN